MSNPADRGEWITTLEIVTQALSKAIDAHSRAVLLITLPPSRWTEADAERLDDVLAQAMPREPRPTPPE